MIVNFNNKYIFTLQEHAKTVLSKTKEDVMGSLSIIMIKVLGEKHRSVVDLSMEETY